MILYAVAAEQSLGRLFLAAIGPALLLVALFTAYAMWRFAGNSGKPRPPMKAPVPDPNYCRRYSSMRDKSRCCPASFRCGAADRVMIALYGGFATPSETAGLGAVLALAFIAIIYSVWSPSDLEPSVFDASGVTMLMLIIGISLLYW